MRKLPTFCTMTTCLVMTLTLHTVAAHGDGHGGLQWPAVSELDELAERGEVMIEKDDIMGLRSLAAQIKDTSHKVVEGGMPKKVRNPLTVKLHLQDIKSLGQSIGDPETMSETDLKHAIAAFHPLVAALMEQAGMPHVHDHHDHDHHDHDHHDHDHDGDHEEH